MKIHDLENIIKKVKPNVGELTSTTLISNAGLTSLDMMIVICEIEKQYARKVHIESLTKANTLGDLYTAIIDNK